MEQIQNGLLTSSSGKVMNRWKQFFLKRASTLVCGVNKERDADGVQYARKAIARCGLATNLNNKWEV